MPIIPPPDRFASFKAAWRLALIRELTAACTDGTVAIGTNCLFELGLRARALPNGAPTGTNDRWVLRQMFNEIIATFPEHLKQKHYST